MKKRTFGRIAALGLAGLTAVPAISIVASANAQISDKRDQDSGYLLITGGPAYKVTWTIRETTHNYRCDPISGAITDNPVYTDKTTPDYDTKTEGTGSYLLNATEYYMYESNAVALIADVKSAVDTASVTYKNDYEDFKNQCADYAFFKKYYESNTASNDYTLKSNKYGAKGTVYRYFKNTGEDELNWHTKNADNSYSIASVGEAFIEIPSWISTAKEYSYSGEGTVTPGKSPISLSALINEIGTAYVTVTNNKIEAVKGAASGTIYQLSASTAGGNSTVTPGVGNYAQYEIPASYRYASNTSYYSYDTETWYPNATSFYYAVGYYPNSTYSGYWTFKTPAYKYSSSRRWFDPYDGNYYSATGGSQYTVLVSADSDYDNTESYVYYSPTTNLYYLTWTAANNATNSNSEPKPIRAIPTYAAFFSMTTGQFYSTYADAYYASGNNSSRVLSVNGASATGAGLDYLDPFYYYYMNGTRLPSSTTSNDTSAVKIGNRTGWTAVASSAKSAKSGSTLNVTMNGETVIPSNVLTSIQGRNVTVNFTLKNGVVYTINGNDVSSAKNIDIDTIYNTKNVPSKLVSKAKSKNNGVSTSQLTIDSGSFGSSADVTVKFATKRAGCTARLYRYNSDKNSLSLVDKSTVNSSGKCTFDGVTKGGDYVIVLS